MQVELSTWNMEFNGTTILNERKLKDKDDWAKALKCDPMPDPEYEQELTSYISSYSDPSKIANLNIKPILESVQYTQEVSPSLTRIFL